jgi:hypothetical protein
METFSSKKTPVAMYFASNRARLEGLNPGMPAIHLWNIAKREYRSLSAADQAKWNAYLEPRPDDPYHSYTRPIILE